MVPTSSPVLWSQGPKAGLAWPSGQHMRRGGKARKGELFSLTLSVCVCVCGSRSGGDVYVVSLCQKLLGATEVFDGLSLCSVTAMHLLCVLCARGWRAAMLWG